MDKEKGKRKKEKGTTAWVKSPASAAFGIAAKASFFLFPFSFFLVTGCLTEKENTALVSPNPFAGPSPVPARTMKSYTEATVATAVRVDCMGRKILAVNPQIGLKPVFRAIGSPQPEIFHNGTAELVVTEGLVSRCRSEEELAAVLCHELGKMVSEREALASPATRTPERRPPLDVPVGNDVGGTFGPADGTRLAELAQYKAPGAPLNRTTTSALPPDPQVLARAYLSKTGYPLTAFDAVAPLLQAAEKNFAWQKQLTTPGPARPWTR